MSLPKAGESRGCTIFFMSQPKNNRWKWVFAFIFTLALSGAGLLIYFNLVLQLSPEKLEAARKLWEANGPLDYVMRYKTLRNQESDDYVVTVRGKKTQEVLVNG